jgi:hypothetical protein
MAFERQAAQKHKSTFEKQKHKDHGLQHVDHN